MKIRLSLYWQFANVETYYIGLEKTLKRVSSVCKIHLVVNGVISFRTNVLKAKQESLRIKITLKRIENWLAF